MLTDNDSYLNISVRGIIWVVKAIVSYFDAGVDRTDEEDVGKDNEDTNVKAKHKCCSAEDKDNRLIRKSSTHHKLINTLFPDCISVELANATYGLLTLGKW